MNGLTKEKDSSSVSSFNLPPIYEIFGELEGIELDPIDNAGFIIISFSKKNKHALFNIVRQLKEWVGRDIYIQLRLMTKT